MIDQASKPQANKEWVTLQINVFSRWVDNQLKGHTDLQIENITKDLSNGVALVELAKALTQKDAPRNWVESPKMNVQKVQNCDLAIDMFSKDGVQLVGISGKDISDNNEKLILGLIWSLILHYSIGKSITSVVSNNKLNDIKNNSTDKPSPSSTINKKTNALKSWAIERTKDYPNVHNFSPYELSMCALLDSYVPEKINYYTLNPSEIEHNTKLASDVMNELGIPVYITSDEVNHFDSNMDDKTLLTQLASMKTILDQHEAERKQIHERSVTVSNTEKSESESEDDQQRAENMRQIEECMRRDQEENKYLPDKVVIDGQEFTNIRVRDIQLEPQVEESKDQKEDSIPEKSIQEQEHDDNMRQIEECMKRDQEENKYLPDKVVIDGQEFTNIRVRDIQLEPKIEENNNNGAKITDNLIPEDAELKVDSSKDHRKSIRNDYVQISHKKKYSSFFEWFFNEVIQQPETLFGTHSRKRSPHFGWCWNLNTPIEAVVYRYN